MGENNRGFRLLWGLGVVCEALLCLKVKHRSVTSLIPLFQRSL